MEILDYVILFFILVWGVQGFVRGFGAIIWYLAGLAASFFAYFVFVEKIYLLLSQWNLPDILIRIIPLILFLFIWGVVQKLLDMTVNTKRRDRDGDGDLDWPSLLSRLAGAVTGIAIMVLFLYMLLSFIFLISPKLVDMVYEYSALLPRVVRYLPGEELILLDV